VCGAFEGWDRRGVRGDDDEGERSDGGSGEDEGAVSAEGHTPLPWGVGGPLDTSESKTLFSCRPLEVKLDDCT